jgi:hypothetical protein
MRWVGAVEPVQHLSCVSPFRQSWEDLLDAMPVHLGVAIGHRVRHDRYVVAVVIRRTRGRFDANARRYSHEYNLGNPPATQTLAERRAMEGSQLHFRHPMIGRLRPRANSANGRPSPASPPAKLSHRKAETPAFRRSPFEDRSRPRRICYPERSAAFSMLPFVNSLVRRRHDCLNRPMACAIPARPGYRSENRREMPYGSLSSLMRLRGGIA